MSLRRPTRAARASLPRFGRELAALSFLALSAFVACEGTISGTPDLGPGASGGPDAAAGDARTGTPPAPGSSTGLRRLTRAQYESSVRALVGADAAFSADLAEVPVSLQAAQVEYTTEAATHTGFSSDDVDALFDSAMAIVGPIFDDATRRRALVGCDAARADDACTRGFVTSFGKRAFRRPLEGDEVDRYVAVATNAATNLDGNVWQGIGYTVSAILQSPSLLYVLERGELDAATQRQRYTSWEMATRLALALTGSAPDDALLASAEQGKLTDPAELRAQAQRLVATDGARANVIGGFFHELFDLGAMSGTGKDPTIFPQWTSALGASMVEELRRTLDDGVFVADLDFGAMFVRRTTFVDASLATLYGLPAPSGPGFQKTTIPDGWDRVGLLGAGAFLSINAKTTRNSPTLRGKFIAERLLCTPISPPPPNIPQLDSEDAGTTPQTLRQKMEGHGTNPACAGCHEVMDPPGFGLEGFDAIGAFRTTDNGLPIDATGTLAGVHFDGPASLATVLSQLPQVKSCLSQQAFRYLAGRTAEATALDPITMAAGGHVRALVVELVNSDAFRFVP